MVRVGHIANKDTALEHGVKFIPSVTSRFWESVPDSFGLPKEVRGEEETEMNSCVRNSILMENI